MPIYAYRCGACGHTQDVLQKLSDPALVTCPACGADAYAKQVTAAGFQLKGSGWYVTDFRGGNNSAAPAKSGDNKPAAEGGSAPAAADAGASAQKSAAPASTDSTPSSKPSEAA